MKFLTTFLEWVNCTVHGSRERPHQGCGTSSQSWCKHKTSIQGRSISLSGNDFSVFASFSILSRYLSLLRVERQHCTMHLQMDINRLPSF